jgi:hypothetical protein
MNLTDRDVLDAHALHLDDPHKGDERAQRPRDDYVADDALGGFQGGDVAEAGASEAAPLAREEARLSSEDARPRRGDVGLWGGDARLRGGEACPRGGPSMLMTLLRKEGNRTLPGAALPGSRASTDRTAPV